MFDAEELGINTEPLDDIGEYDDYKDPAGPAPVPKGKHRVTILDTVRVGKTGFDPRFIEATVNVQVVGGSYDGRIVKFLRFHNAPGRKGQASVWTSLMKSAEANNPGLSFPRPTTNKDYLDALDLIMTTGAIVIANLDWKARSQAAYKAKLAELTGQTDYDAAKNVATPEQKTEANSEALIHSTYSRFPDNGNGGKESVVVCPHTGEEVFAEVFLRHFLTKEK